MGRSPTTLLSLLSLSLGAAIAVSLVDVRPAVAVGPGGWDRVGNGGAPNIPSLNATVSAVKTVGSVLYAGGNFTDAGGDPSGDRIAKWNGTAWRPLGTGLAGGQVFAIAESGGKIFAGGDFQNASGNPDADGLAVFDGVSWAPYCDDPAHVGPTVNGGVKALQVIGSKMYVGGTFQNAAG